MRNCALSRRGGTNGSRLWTGWLRAERKSGEELARKESALSAFADLDVKMQASRREIENADRLIISCRRERDNLIARQAQIKQRQEQMEAARTRLATGRG